MLSLNTTFVAGPVPRLVIAIVYSIVSPGDPPSGAVSTASAAALVAAKSTTGLNVWTVPGGIVPFGPSSSIVATLVICVVTPGFTRTWKRTIADAPAAITPSGEPGLLINRAAVNGIAGPARS